MIRKCRVHSYQFNFWHVAGHTILRTHRTRRCITPFCSWFLRARYVTRQALRIVIRRILRQWLMRIMTSQTSGAYIVCVVSLAIKYPVGLEANIVDARLARHQHRLVKARVTRPTERL